MNAKNRPAIDFRRVELDGSVYVILRESAFDMLCQRAGLEGPPAPADGRATLEHLDGASLAEKLIRRRRASGLSQAELARRAGVRPETLNRIERGRTTPDFSTIRKLVLAISAAEREVAGQTPSLPSETSHAPKKRNPRK
jgi:DNA-binding XRE family transcriptional regulator